MAKIEITKQDIFPLIGFKVSGQGFRNESFEIEKFRRRNSDPHIEIRASESNLVVIENLLTAMSKGGFVAIPTELIEELVKDDND